MRGSVGPRVARGPMFGAAVGSSDAVPMTVGAGAGVAWGARVGAWSGRTGRHHEEDAQ